MARIQNIKSDGLTYSVETIRRAAYGSGRGGAAAIWDGSGLANPTYVNAGTNFTFFELTLRDREVGLGFTLYRF
jgi:hypothetical protein